MSRALGDRKCKVCSHPERARIELAACTGTSIRAVGRKFGLSKTVLGRHLRLHVSQERRVALSLGPIGKFTLEEALQEESKSVVEHLRATRAGLWQLYSTCIENGDVHGASTIALRLIDCNRVIGKITGELLDEYIRPTKVSFFASPEFVTFQAAIMRVLNEYPSARVAVIKELKQLETNKESEN